MKDIVNSAIAHWLRPIIIFMIAFAMQRSVALLGLDLHHDSFMFDAAKRLLDGEVPFRDFFYQYNLGTVFFHMLALKAFGTYVASLKIATSIVYALIAFLIYMCAAVLNRPWQGFGMALVWSTLSPFYLPTMNGYHAWSTVYMMASVMAGSLFLLMALRKRTGIYSGFAGLCFNLAFWFKQIAGLQILIVVVWILLNTRYSQVGEGLAKKLRMMLRGFVLGGLISAIPFFGYLFLNDSLVDWWRSAFVFNKYFALTGGSSASLKDFLQNMFPVQRDLGYTTYMWVILPLFIGVMFLGGKNKGIPLPFRADEWSRNASLLLMLGFAGWLEYFPLSHAFHTQLLLAPVFSLIALGQNNDQKEATDRSWRRMVTPFLLLMAVIIVREVFVHLGGLREKIARPGMIIEHEMPAKGLKLLPEYATSFERFAKVAKTAQPSGEDLPAIPMSQDPIRAIFPGLNSTDKTFRMGVDWTWPNELIEPGFNQRRSKLIHERRSPIYGDSILAIPGYIPSSLLEMPSPFGMFHTLYKPSADIEIKDPPVTTINKIIKLNEVLVWHRKNETDGPQGLNLACEAGDFHSEILIPYGRLPESALANISQLHVSIIGDSDFSKQLTGLEYKQFMIPAMANFDREIGPDQFYIQESNGKYGLKATLTETDWLYLAKFFLSRGKLYNPRFATTLAQSEKNRPLLVTKPEFGVCPRIAWSKVRHYAGVVTANEDLYLAIPDDRFNDGNDYRFDDGDPVTMYVQVVFKDNTTYNRYLRFGYEESGTKNEKSFNALP